MPVSFIPQIKAAVESEARSCMERPAYARLVGLNVHQRPRENLYTAYLRAVATRLLADWAFEVLEAEDGTATLNMRYRIRPD